VEYKAFTEVQKVLAEIKNRNNTFLIKRLEGKKMSSEVYLQGTGKIIEADV
jgi:hypothetical protein